MSMRIVWSVLLLATLPLVSGASSFYVEDSPTDAQATILIGQTVSLPDLREGAARATAEILSATMSDTGATLDVAIALASTETEEKLLEQVYNFKFVIRGRHWDVDWTISPVGGVVTTLCTQEGANCASIPGTFAAGFATASIPRGAVVSTPTFTALAIEASSRVVVSIACFEEPCPTEFASVSTDRIATGVPFYAG